MRQVTACNPTKYQENSYGTVEQKIKNIHHVMCNKINRLFNMRRPRKQQDNFASNVPDNWIILC